jgi:glutathione S-transferase
MQPITLYSHPLGPNPWKVAIVLSILKIPYENIFVDFKDVKLPAITNLNPNGRLPIIVDPNHDITLWESGAIINYLIDNYDVSHKLSYHTFPERFLTQQWLFFQASGQGPYYGQLGWFRRQSEQQPAAIKRYADEVLRVTSVLESALKDRNWLVGEKCTFADLSFVPWQDMVGLIMGDEVAATDLECDFPNVQAWMQRMKDIPEVKTVLLEKQRAMSNNQA